MSTHLLLINLVYLINLYFLKLLKVVFIMNKISGVCEAWSNFKFSMNSDGFQELGEDLCDQHTVLKSWVAEASTRVLNLPPKPYRCKLPEISI